MGLAARAALWGYTVGVVIALAKVHAVRYEYDYSGSSRLAWSIGYIAVLNVVAYGAGLPDAVERRREAFVAALQAVTVATLGVSVVQLVVGDTLLPRFVVFGAAPLLVGGYWGLAAFAVRGRDRRRARDRVMLVGTVSEAEMIRRDLAMAPERPAVLVGWIGLDQAKVRSEEGTGLEAAVTSSQCTLLVLSREAQNDDTLVHQAAVMHERGVRVRTLQVFYEQWLSKLPVGELERVSLLFDISELHRAWYVRTRRLLDLVLAALAALPLTVLIPIVALLNVAGNRGPLFYRQVRVGKGGREFRIIKFRTMRPAPAGLVDEWTTEDDPRITPFGRILRRTHLDETPQLLNILRGELSFVGPRPEQPHYVEELRSKLPFYGLRHLVTPGITGWAQVKYGYAGSESDALEKLQYEFYYLRHQSLSFDLRILARTIRSVIGLAGR